MVYMHIGNILVSNKCFHIVKEGGKTLYAKPEKLGKFGPEVPIDTSKDEIHEFSWNLRGKVMLE